MSINKEQAIKRLNAIEEETKELHAIINKKDDWTSITDVESACAWLGERDQDVKEYRFMLGTPDLSFSKRTMNQKALEVCIKAVNTDNEDSEPWQPNWNKQSERKWYNWFEKTKFGWSVYGRPLYLCYVSVLGSGFYYESEEKAKHGARYFKPYYDIWLE